MSHAKINDTIRLKKLTALYNQLRSDAGVLHLALLAALCEKTNGDAPDLVHTTLPEGLAVHINTNHVRAAHEMAKQGLDVSVTLDTAKHTLTMTVVKVKS